MNSLRAVRVVPCVPILLVFCVLTVGCGSDTQPTLAPTGPQVVLASAIQIDPLDAIYVDRAPLFIHLVLPEYPRMAQNAGLEGTVWVSVYVDESGLPHDAQVYQSSTIPSFDDAVARSAEQCRYLPAQYRGADVAVRVMYAVDFKLP